MTDRQEWWRGAVIYQIYPRSFQDDDGDGVGDLAGITRRLGHVADLGVDAIWLSPIFTSPMADMGYDVSDHCGIDPSFGTMADFDALVAEAHRLGLKVLLDQVLSHSSDRHPFFLASKQSRDNPKADWYVWADPKPDGSPPSNWQAIFGGPAWEWEVRRRQYYFHNFLKEQPDFDFHNPEVQDWALSVLDFWLDRGVDGFRLDAVNFYAHDRALPDNPRDERPEAAKALKPYDMQLPLHSKNQPATLTFLERMRSHLDARGGADGGAVLIGEIGELHRPAELLAEYTSGRRLHMGYNSEMMGSRFSAAHVRRQIARMFHESGPEGWPAWAFSNHDVPRHVSRWAAHGESQDALARLCAVLLLSLEGAVCLYQGEELGLTDTELSYDELADPEGLAFWPDNKGRDGGRTPMVWEAEARHAGFSTAAKTWLPVKEPQRARAVDRQSRDPGSVLAFYRRAVALRRDTPELRTGRTRFLETTEPVLAFWRGERVLCAFNLGPEPADIALNSDLEALLSTDGVALEGERLRLPGNGALVARSTG